MTDFDDDEKIVAMTGREGPIGQARLLKIYRIIARQMDSSDRCEVRYRAGFWITALWFRSVIDCRSFLDRLAIDQLLIPDLSGNDWSIKCPKLLEIRARKSAIGSKIRTLDIEEEVEVEKRKRKERSDLSSDLTPLSQFWNTNSNGLPKIISMSPDRKNKERLRIKSLGEEKLKAAILKAVATPFCNGNNDQGWKVTYDWIISKDNNVLKLLEGKYDQRKPVQQSYWPTGPKKGPFDELDNG